MKIISLLLILFVSFISANSNLEKTIKLNKTHKQIIIDGSIDEAWSEADSISDFIQLSPFYNSAPTNKTIIKTLTTDENLYFLAICWAPKNTISSINGRHDNYLGDDVTIMFDSFGDRKSAYQFSVSAAGVKGDARMIDDGRNRDFSWDGVWFAESKIFDCGFIIEIMIPYKTIHYDEELIEWGIDFSRWVANNTEDNFWCLYEEHEGVRISKFGKLLLNGFKPSVKSLNLEIFPVTLIKAEHIRDNKYKIKPTAGVDVLYNPSSSLAYQMTVNPDFAQIEADPFNFNISRYESYLNERRPFFTQGNEIFIASGRESNSGFYRPLELFYSRRIGKKLNDGTEVPIFIGTKVYGRTTVWEYGGFYALTGEVDYIKDDSSHKELQSHFASARIKKQIFENSVIGALFVCKKNRENSYSVINVDGAFRQSNWQLAYQIAGAFENKVGGPAFSAGFRGIWENWAAFARTRFISERFNIKQIGYAPWEGTSQLVVLTGPRWFIKSGGISNIMIYTGPALNYENIDLYMDRVWALGVNFQFRDGWGFELNSESGKSRDDNVSFDSYSINLSSWFNTGPKWNANFWGGVEKSYNFNRNYLAFYSWAGFYFNWRAASTINMTINFDSYFEGNPEGKVEETTINARPGISISPINNLNLRIYVDNTYISSSERIENILIGILFSYNYSPKSWIYAAYNEIREREESEYNSSIKKLLLKDRAGVFKVSYLYYF